MNRQNGLREKTDVLAEIVKRFGTPTYAFDVRQLRRQVQLLRSHLPDSIQLYYSLKANASLGICNVFADCEIGADVASAGELATAIEAGFTDDQIFVAGPFKLPETVELLRDRPAAVLSVDSPDELAYLASERLVNRVLLRLRPDFGSCAVVPAGSESRFGFTDADLSRCRDRLDRGDLEVTGFHVFAGSQVLESESVNNHLRRAFELCRRAASVLEISPTILNLGGGFGIPYSINDERLDLAVIGNELERLAEQAAPARLALELGRFLVAEAGWYLTSVVGNHTHQCRPAVIVDGGTHQRADMCGLCLRTNADPPIPIRLDVPTRLSNKTTETEVLGCLSLPADVLAEASPLPQLTRGDVLAFANAGAYGVWSSPALFHGSPLPAEVAFDGSEIQLMRGRKAACSILDDQRPIVTRPSPIHT